MNKKGLGRGLDALFSAFDDEEEKIETVAVKTQQNQNEQLSRGEDGVVELDIKKVDPNKGQPRKSFDATSL